MTNDLHVEIAAIQKEIEGYIGGLESNSIIFQFDEIDNGVKLDVVTVNPRHRQSFLFQSVVGYDKLDSLKKMLAYVEEFKAKESSYTIQWSLHGEDDLQTSYFRAKNVMEALDKLYYGRDMNAVTVFSVVLNPLS